MLITVQSDCVFRNARLTGFSTPARAPLYSSSVVLNCYDRLLTTTWCDPRRSCWSNSPMLLLTGCCVHVKMHLEIWKKEKGRNHIRFLWVKNDFVVGRRSSSERDPPPHLNCSFFFFACVSLCFVSHLFSYWPRPVYFGLLALIRLCLVNVWLSKCSPLKKNCGKIVTKI